MTKENKQIGGQTYTLYTNYQQEEKLRQELNRMTRNFWGFDFENYYQSGYWDDSCILYSLFENDTIVAHTTASLFTSRWDQQPKTLLQVGTVMTDEAYRNRGLSRFLMEYILKKYQDKTDGTVLFANETVYEFYPKFGLVPVSEYQAIASAPPDCSASKLPVRKLALSEPEDLRLLEQAVRQAVPNSAFPLQSQTLPFFYCVANPEFGFSDALYYIDDLKSVVVLQEDEGIQYLQEIIAPQEIAVEQVINALSGEKKQEIRLGFTPLNGEFEFRPYGEDDLKLFVSPHLQPFFENQKLMVPVLSHT